MKESLAKITAWIKAHPIPAAIIGLVVVVVGYFVVKSSGGNPGGESIDGGTLGADEATPLVGLAGGDMSAGGTTSTGTTPESISTGTTPAYNDITTPQASESIETFSAPSDYINDGGIFSAPTSAAEVLNVSAKYTGRLINNTGNPPKPLSGGGVAAAIKKPAAALLSTKPLSGGGVAAGIKKGLGSLGSISSRPTPQKHGWTPAPPKTINTMFFSALRPSTFNIYKYIGAVSGYNWDSQLKRYVKSTGGKTMQKV